MFLAGDSSVMHLYLQKCVRNNGQIWLMLKQTALNIGGGREKSEETSKHLYLLKVPKKLSSTSS